MILNEYGGVVEEEITKTQEMREEITIDSYVVMPNHVHILVMTQRRVRMHSHPTDKTGSSWVFDERWALWLQGNNISSIIRGLKASVTRRIRQEYNNYEFKWQRSFYDVIVKNDEQLNKTRLYIKNNPLKWELDVNNPENEEEVKKLRAKNK